MSDFVDDIAEQAAEAFSKAQPQVRMNVQEWECLRQCIANAILDNMPEYDDRA